jgi:uncharacterized membrane-anchored protein YitT (DUF2179 family)
MKRRRKSIGILWEYTLISVGTLVLATGIHVFLSPNNIAPGGLTGFLTLVHHLTGLNIGTMYFIVNIPILIAGFIMLGRRFIIRTTFSAVLFSVALDAFLGFVPQYIGDPNLSALYGGLLCGVGLSMVFYSDASTGGMDVVNRIIKKKLPFISLGKIVLAGDALVVVLSAVVYGNIEAALYSLISIFVSSLILEKVENGSIGGLTALIISRESEAISQKILSEMERGCTVMKAEGAYSNDET